MFNLNNIFNTLSSSSYCVIHTIQPPNITKNQIRLISIDPGIKNFSIRIETRKDSSINTELFERVNLQGNILINLTRYLDQYLFRFRESDIIIIEKQLTKNSPLIRVSQHVLSYFVIKLLDIHSIILEIDPKAKTRLLNAPKLDKRKIKTWSIITAIQILQERKDILSLSILEKEKKKDDLADTVCQSEALFKILTS